MSNYSNTKATIAANVYTNHNNEVTAAMVKTGINTVVDALIAGGYLWAGVAHPGDAASTPDANVVKVATEVGTYTNYKNSSNVALTVAAGEVAVFTYNGSWSKAVTGAATAAEVSALGQKLYYFSDVAVNSTANGWYLRGDGLCASDGSKRLRKYLVTAGQTLHLELSKDSNGVYQFQSAASVPSSGTNANLVGTPVNDAVNGEVVVPSGATYLIVSESTSNTTNKVQIVGLNLVIGWILAEAFTASSITRDSNGNVTAANVVWPDGKTGSLSITRNADGAATQMVATYDGESYTLSITRDSDGLVTATSIN